MATGVALPGTIVPIGALLSPGGSQGLQGVQGNPGQAGAAGQPGSPGVAGPPGIGELVGSVKAWPAVTAPANWMLMDGSAISRTLYPDLFTLIGTTFGTGDGSTTFNLPDARGRFILPTGQGASLANRILAAVGGEETHVLVTAELAAHAHSIAAGQFNHGHGISDPTHKHSLYYSYTFNSGGQAPNNYGMDVGGSSFVGAAAAGTGIGIAANTLPAGSTANNGSGTGHNTMPPFLVLTFIIKVSAGGATDKAAIADTTQAGLVNKISGYQTDYLTGANTCQPLPSATRIALGFTMPSVGYTVNITVNDTSWMSAGMILNLLVGGNLQQVQINSITGNQLGVTNYAGPVTGAVSIGALVTYGAFAVAGVNQPGIVNALSGNVTDYIGGDNACHALPPGVGPTADYYDKDDMFLVSASQTKLLIVSSSGAAGNVAGQYNVNLPGHPGIIQLAPGTTTGAFSRAYTGYFAAFDGSMTLTIESVLTIPAGNYSGNNQFFFGVCNSVGPAISASYSYCGFLALATNNANWAFYTRNLAVANVYTYTNVPVLPGNVTTWHLFKIVITGAAPATAQFYIDNVLVGSVADNSLPTATTMLYSTFFTNNSNGTANLSMLIDTFDILVQPGGSARFMR